MKIALYKIGKGFSFDSNLFFYLCLNFQFVLLQLACKMSISYFHSIKNIITL